MKTSYIIGYKLNIIASCDNNILAALCLNNYIDGIIRELEEDEDKELRNVFPRTGERREINDLEKIRNFLITRLESEMRVGESVFYGGFYIQCVKRWDA